jgi:condensin complex subunit 1
MLTVKFFLFFRDISEKEFNGQDTTGPKSFSKFLIKLSALVPKVVIKQIGLLKKHLESDVSNKENKLVSCILIGRSVILLMFL